MSRTTLFLFLLWQVLSSAQAQNTYQYIWSEELYFNPYSDIIADNTGSIYVTTLHLNSGGIFMGKHSAQGIYQQGTTVAFPPYFSYLPTAINHFNDNSICLIVPLDTNAQMRRIGIIHFDNNLQVNWTKLTPIDHRYLYTTMSLLYEATNEIWFAAPRRRTPNIKEIDVFSITETGNLSQQHSYQIPIFSQEYSHLDVVSGLQQTSDGNFIILASGTKDINNSVPTTVLLKITPQGEVIWSKTFNENAATNKMTYHKLVPNNDGGYLLVGNYQNDIIMTQLDSQGNVLWTKLYDYAANSYVLSLLKRSANNDGYIGLFSGGVTSITPSHWSIACFDEQGTICWQKTYEQNLSIKDFLVQPDGYAFLGSLTEYFEDTNGFPQYNRTIMLSKVDLNGDLFIDCLPAEESTMQLMTPPNIVSVDLEVNHVVNNVSLITPSNQVVASYDVTTIPHECPPPIALFQLSDTLLCPNSPYNCIAATDSSLNNPNEWLWLMPGASPDTYSGINPPAFCYDDAGIYTISLIVSNNYDSDTTSYTIEVSNLYCIPPTADFYLEQSQLCTHSCIAPINLLPDESLSYVWYANGASPDTYNGINPPAFCYDEVGTYTIRLVASNNTDSVVVTKNIVVADSSQVQIEQDMCMGSTYIWNDTTIVTAGSYIQVLTSEGGCDSTVTVNLRFISCDLEHLFPNAFSPDGNQINDLFRPITSYASLSWQVYNRWGEKVFEAKDSSQAWDGTCKGEPCPIGVYVWAVQYQITENGNTQAFTKQGNVTLIR